MLPIFLLCSTNEHELVVRSLSGGTDDVARRVIYTDLRFNVPPLFIGEDNCLVELSGIESVKYTRLKSCVLHGTPVFEPDRNPNSKLSWSGREIFSYMKGNMSDENGLWDSMTIVNENGSKSRYDRHREYDF